MPQRKPYSHYSLFDLTLFFLPSLVNFIVIECEFQQNYGQICVRVEGNGFGLTISSVFEPQWVA